MPTPDSPLIKADVDLSPMTTFGIPAKARWYAEYADVRQLRHIMRQPEYQDSEVFHIGGGSNILFTRPYYDGMVLRSGIRGLRHYIKDDHTAFMIAGAAEEWDAVVAYAVENGLAGLENLSGIPGQAGASVIQNIGAYGAEAADTFFKAECFDTFTGETVTFDADACRFGYRDSIFKREARGRYYVLRVSFRLRPSTEASSLGYGPLRSLAEELGHTPSIADVRRRVIEIRNTKLPDPATVGSAGSFFKNPVVREHFYTSDLLPKFPDMPHYPAGDGNVKIPAGWLIEHAGLKGESSGGASVWPSQCLVIANTANATGADVVRLADHIRETVKARFNVSLSREVNYVQSGLTLTILGSGTSKGVPELGCSCHVCRSESPDDKRLRCSALVRVNDLNILIDSSPDMREQLLRAGIDRIDCVLLTHEHYDHVGGLDDLRPFCGEKPMPVYALPHVADAIRERLPYCFRTHAYPGVPRLDLRTFTDMPFYFQGVKIDPVEVMHGTMPIAGFRIGNLGYITDAKTIDPDELAKLSGVDTLVINALRRTEHFAHLTIDEALAVIRRLHTRRAYLTHLSHEAGLNADLAASLPDGVFPATDGLQVSV